MRASLIACASVVLVLVSAEVVFRWTKTNAEDTRALVHVAVAVVAALLPIFMTHAQIAVIASIFCVVMTVSKREGVLRSIHGVDRRTIGEIAFPAGIATLALAGVSWPLYEYGVVVMGLGDAAANVVGRRCGRHRIRVARGHKSVEGSAALFVVAFLAGTVVLRSCGVAATRGILAALATALVVTLVEAALTLGLDDLVLPLAAAVTLGLLGGV